MAAFYEAHRANFNVAEPQTASRRSVVLLVSKERAGEQGDDYFVKYPTSSNRNCFLEWHLRKGSNKDTRYCLGIYFFWDDDTQQIVVGWLPSHLDNRMT